MENKKWTKPQLDAINARNGSILVSAAAGSGKTAVLVQRVIEILVDEEKPCDANKLLIVTFTNAAAAEMKERISERLSELIRQRPFDNRLKRQQVLLSNAHISTIHSFCNNIIREHFYILGVSKDFKIADTSKMSLLREDAIASILDSNYNSGSRAFFNLVEAFSSEKNDKRLIQIINLLYDFIRSHPFPELWLDEKILMYDSNSPIENTPFGKVLINYSMSLIEYCIASVKRLVSLVENHKVLCAYLQTFNEDLTELEKAKVSLGNDTWDEIFKVVGLLKLATLKRVSGVSDDPIKIKVMEKRKEIKSIISQVQSLFCSSSDECKTDTEKLRYIVSELFSVVKQFSQKLDELKKERDICDFGDLEHLVLKLLVKPDKNNSLGFLRTEQAIELSKRFKFVMVDECQDINEAQDMIFRAVSRDESNLFMVGDVKQSIYRFRQAMPELFLNKKNKYNYYVSDEDNYPAKIILDKNFRSRKGVLNAVNFVFEKIMSKEVGEMEYTDEEKLAYGAKYEDKTDTDVSLKVLDLSLCDNDADMNKLEARYISEQIFKMISSGYTVKDGDSLRPVTYKDFCVLLRNANKHAKAFAHEMSLCGIPTFTENSGSFFATSEVSTVLALLNIIDNPIQDIALITVLLSPIAGFSADELCLIRHEDKCNPFYFALKEFSSKDAKSKMFLEKLERWRILATTMPSDTLVNYIYEETNYTNIVQAMENGSLRLDNLRLLLEYARNFEAGETKGLSSFIRFINRLKENKIDLNCASSMSGVANAVTVMSIHKSKGLEFPVCFIANCSRKFNKDRDEILLDPSLGIGIKLFDKKLGYRYSSYQRDAVKLVLENSAMSEELRVLYVAMTRAKEKLIMLTSLKNVDSSIFSLANKLSFNGTVSPYAVKTASSFSDWFLLCALSALSENVLCEDVEKIKKALTKNSNVWEVDFVTPSIGEKLKPPSKNIEEEVPVDEKFLKLIKNRLSFKYPLSPLFNIPTKVTVTDLSSGENKRHFDFSKVPIFSLKEKITPAQKGTALHTFLQFVNFREARLDLENEISRLVTQGYLQSDLAKKLNRREIKRFLDSSLVSRIIESPKVLREYKFTTRLRLKDYDENVPLEFENEEIILQGAVDCMFQEDDEFVVVDYKTDRFKSISEMKAKYAKQLLLYSSSVKKCTDINVKQNILYLFYTGEQIFL